VALGSRKAGFSLHVFADDNQIAGNHAKVRVYHMSPGIGAVDVSTGGHRLIAGLPYGQASNYVSVAPGAYTFNVMAVQDGRVSSVSVQLKPWTVTSIFAISPLKSHTANATLQFVQEQITGMPGMPGTGSDPHALPVPAPPASPFSVSWPLVWLMLGVCLAATAAMLISRRTRGKASAEHRKEGNT
jgi:hypothetical protein